MLQTFSVFLIGASLGWLTGLSLSPVVATLLASLVTLVVAAISIVSGIKSPIQNQNEKTEKEENSDKKILKASVPIGKPVNMVPVAVLVFSIALGTPVGLIARTNQWFGVGPMEASVNDWVRLGRDREAAVQVLYTKWAEADWKEVKPTNDSTEVRTGGLLSGDGLIFCEQVKAEGKDRALAIAKGFNLKFIEKIYDELDEETSIDLVQQYCESIGFKK